MFPTLFSALLTCTLTVPALASANPDPVLTRDSPLTLSFTRLADLGLATGHTLYQRDLRRAQSFKSRSDSEEGSETSKRAVISTPADNQVVSYIATVGVGSPPTQCRVTSSIIYTGAMDLMTCSFLVDSLIIDTGRLDATIIIYLHAIHPNPARILGLVGVTPTSRLPRASIPVTQSYVCLCLLSYLLSVSIIPASVSHLRIGWFQRFAPLSLQPCLFAQTPFISQARNISIL